MYRTIPCSLLNAFQSSKMCLSTSSSLRLTSYATAYATNVTRHKNVPQFMAPSFRPKSSLAAEKVDQEATPSTSSTKTEADTPVLPSWVQSAFDRDIYLSKDFPSLISTIKKANLSIKNALNILALLGTWVEHKSVESKVVMENPEFKKVCSKLENGVGSVNIYNLLQAIKALHIIGFTSDSFLVNALENDLLWNLRKLNLRQLIFVAKFQQPYRETETQKRVLKEVTQAIQRRWVEITDVHDLVQIFNMHQIFEDRFLIKLEDRVVDNMENLSMEDKVKLLTTLAACKRRPTPLLRSLAFHLNKDSTKLTPKLSSDLLFALNRLSFPDQVLLERIGNDLTSEIAEITKPALISSCLINMGQLRYRNTSVLEALADWLDKNWDKCRSQEFVAFLLCYAAVDFTPSNSATIFPKLKSVLSKESIKNDLVWLDIVWSWAIFDQVTEQELRSVLDSQIVSANPIVKNKFASLRTLATKDPRFNLQYPIDNIPADSKGADGTVPGLSRAVLDALANFVPAPRYLKEQVNTNMGVNFDAEFIMTSSCSPLPLQDFETKPLPPGASRIALKVMDYKDMCLGSTGPTGYNVLARRILELNNYRVIFVPHTEFPAKEKLLKKVQYLERLVKANLAGDQV